MSSRHNNSTASGSQEKSGKKSETSQNTDIHPVYPMLVCPRLASQIGLPEALFICQLDYWLNNPNCGYVARGLRWVYNTVDQWLNQFLVFSRRTFERIIAKLRSRGFILTRNAWASEMWRQSPDYPYPGNQTLHYTLNYPHLKNELGWESLRQKKVDMSSGEVEPPQTQKMAETFINSDSAKMMDCIPANWRNDLYTETTASEPTALKQVVSDFPPYPPEENQSQLGAEPPNPQAQPFEAGLQGGEILSPPKREPPLIASQGEEVSLQFFEGGAESPVSVDSLATLEVKEEAAAQESSDLGRDNFSAAPPTNCEEIINQLDNSESAVILPTQTESDQEQEQEPVRSDEAVTTQENLVSGAVVAKANFPQPGDRIALNWPESPFHQRVGECVALNQETKEVDVRFDNERYVLTFPASRIILPTGVDSRVTARELTADAPAADKVPPATATAPAPEKTGSGQDGTPAPTATPAPLTPVAARPAADKVPPTSAPAAPEQTGQASPRTAAPTEAALKVGSRVFWDGCPRKHPNFGKPFEIERFQYGMAQLKGYSVRPVPLSNLRRAE